MTPLSLLAGRTVDSHFPNITKDYINVTMVDAINCKVNAAYKHTHKLTHTIFLSYCGIAAVETVAKKACGQAQRNVP